MDGGFRLVGRDRERALLDDARALAAAEQPQVRVLIGDPGIGKTALGEDLVRAAADDGWVTVPVACSEDEADIAFAAIDLVLRGLAPHRTDAAARSSLAAAEPDRFAIGMALVDAVASAADGAPVLLVIDDAQWLDAPSSEVLAFARRRLVAEPVLLVFATRPGVVPLPAEGAPVIDVGGIDGAPAATLLAAHVATPVAPDVAEQLARSCAGNPLATIEAARRLPAAVLAAREPLPERLPVPPSLAAMFAERIDRCRDPERLALAVVALAGSDVDAVGPVLDRLSVPADSLRRLSEAGLLATRDHGGALAHPLLRDGAIAAVGPDAVSRIHLQIASVPGLSPERRAHHLEAAAEIVPDELAEALEVAAHDALVRGGAAIAAPLLRRAARATPPGGARVARLSSAAALSARAGELVEALACIEEACTMTRAAAVHDGALALRQVASIWTGGGADLRAARATALDLAGRDPGGATVVAVTAAMALQSSGALAEANELVDAVIAACPRRLEALEVMRANLRVLSGERRAFIGVLQQLFDERHDAVDEASERFGVQTWAVLGPALNWCERHDDAFTLVSEQGRRAAHARSPHARALPASIECETEWWRGRWDAAVAAGRLSIDLAAQTNQPRVEGFALALTGRVVAARGDEVEARHLAHRALGLATELQSGPLSMYAMHDIGLLELGLGRHRDAVEALGHAAESARVLGDHEITVIPYGADHVEALLHAGYRSRALDELARFDERVEDLGSTWGRASAARCHGLLDEDPDASDTWFRAAVDHAADYAFERARSQLAWGTRLRRRANKGDAPAHLLAALATFDSLRAVSWATRTRAELAAMGHRTTPAARGSAGDLTPQELQVALAVSQGMSNRQAAEALFISAKTVDYHLSKVYRKLGISSRTQLARLMASEPDVAS